jgi:D-serine deaminase-like pyridoxal phosphate-dependent protein
VVTSGTPSFACALACDGLRALGKTRHRVSPGTVVFADSRTLDLDELDFLPAALVASRVVSWPTPATVTCDAGSKALAAEAGDPCALALGWPGLVAKKPSEEHLPFEVASGARPARGDVLLLVPRHVCPTVNLAEEALVIEAGREAGTFPVSARAHDLRA